MKAVETKQPLVPNNKGQHLETHVITGSQVEEVFVS